MRFSRNRNRSILFCSPAYYISFIYREELVQRGWTVDIFADAEFDEKLLYGTDSLIRSPKLAALGKLGVVLRYIWKFAFFLAACFKYRYFVFYGGVNQFLFFEKQIPVSRLLGRPFAWSLEFAKWTGAKIIHLPSGCVDEVLKSEFGKWDKGNVCANCGWGESVCNNVESRFRMGLVNEYVDMVIGNDPFDYGHPNEKHFRFRVIDLELWNPDIPPAVTGFEQGGSIKVLHSFYDKGRMEGGKNIKGSRFILEAVEKLKADGFDVDYVHLQGLHSSEMRFHQVKADIIVDQLIYGWFGSTAVEGLALGKPVICYLRPSWKEFFLKRFPEYDELPIVEADTSTIYNVLRKLVTDADYRRQKGEESRRFAEAHFDPERNTKEFIEILETL